MLRLTVGLRSAGSLGNVVFFAGPSLGESAISIFAFNADGTYIGAEKTDGLRKHSEMAGGRRQPFTRLSGTVKIPGELPGV